jgi:hypothetical protein
MHFGDDNFDGAVPVARPTLPKLSLGAGVTSSAHAAAAAAAALPGIPWDRGRNDEAASTAARHDDVNLEALPPLARQLTLREVFPFRLGPGLQVCCGPRRAGIIAGLLGVVPFPRVC